MTGHSKRGAIRWGAQTPFRFAALVMVAPLPPPVNGQSKNTRVLVDRVRATGAKPSVVRVKPGLGGTRSLSLHGRKALSMMRAVFCLVTNVRHRRRHLYLVADGGAGCLYTASLLLLARATGHRVFLHHRTFGYFSRLNRVYAWVFPRVDRTIYHVFLCDTMADRFAEIYGEPTHGRVVSNAAHVDAPESPPAPRQSGSSAPLVLGLLSNLHRDKGLDDSLAVLRAARAEGLSVRLRLAGPAATPEAEQLITATKAEVGDALDWVGPAYGDDKATFYQSLDVFLFPTRYRFEAQPNVVFEAAAHGLPVIAFGRGCVASDLPGLHGQVIPTDADFPQQVLPALRAWAADRAALVGTQQAAWAATAAARSAARRDLEDFVDEMVGHETDRPSGRTPPCFD